MNELPESAETPEQQQLRLLARLHYVLAAITAAMAPLWAYVAYLGWPLLHPPAGSPMYQGPEWLDPLLWGAALVASGVVLFSLSLMHAAILVYVGRCLAQRRRRLFCLLFSAFDLTYAPLGTALGVYVLVLLTRPPVKAMFR